MFCFPNGSFVRSFCLACLAMASASPPQLLVLSPRHLQSYARPSLPCCHLHSNASYVTLICCLFCVRVGLWHLLRFLFLAPLRSFPCTIPKWSFLLSFAGKFFERFHHRRCLVPCLLVTLNPSKLLRLFHDMIPNPWLRELLIACLRKFQTLFLDRESLVSAVVMSRDGASAWSYLRAMFFLSLVYAWR